MAKTVFIVDDSEFILEAAGASLEAAGYNVVKLPRWEDLDRVMGDALEALRIVALLAFPAMPTTSTTIWERIGLDEAPVEARLPDAAAWGLYPGGLQVVKGDALFPRIKA